MAKHEKDNGALSRALQGAHEGTAALPALSNAQLQKRIQELESEVAALRAATNKVTHLESGMTELRDANQNLVLATVNAQFLQDDAEAANRKQREYLSMLAHELRNPLGPITLASVMLGKISNASPELVKLEQIISRQAAHMARLLDDLLDAARINSGKVTLIIQPVLLNDVINQAAEIVQPCLAKHRQTLKLRLPSDSIVINGDTVRLTQIFSNLLHNACKFGGSETDIALTAAMLDGKAIVTVQDQGVGIAPVILPTIFELFTQGPRPLARSEGGLGIGLNIARNLVTLHDGTVEAHSEGINRGTTFTVTLPAHEDARARIPIEPIPALVSKVRRVLLVEDQQDAREALSAFLELEGHTVSVASDGEAGLVMAVNNAYDVLICDIGLPGMDGIELVQRLRSEGLQKMPFAIALSGYGDALIRTRAADAGFDRYLVKPADSNALVRLLAEP